NLELALSDLQVVERRLQKVEKSARSGDKEAQMELALLKQVQTLLSEGKPARLAQTNTEDEARLLRGYNLLTAKRELYLANVAETLAWEDFVATGDQKVAREKGMMRSEGKEYVVQNGDILLFRFNV